MIEINNFPVSLSQIITSIIYIALGMIVYNIIKGILNRKTVISKNVDIQKYKTVKSLILNIIKYVDIFIVIIALLALFGVNVKSILAGLGIGTIILGLAFQDIAKDILAGMAIVIENYYKVGDTIEVDGFLGEVINISLKSTKIKDYQGAVKIVANRNMDTMINYSENNYLTVLDIPVAYENDPEEVEKVLNELFPKLKEKIKDAKGDFQIMGISKLDDSSVNYRISIEVAPTKQYVTERIIRKEILKEFDKKGIKIPYQQIEVHNGK